MGALRREGALLMRWLLHALERPARVAAGEHHPRLAAAAGRHEVGLVLSGAGLVVHEHEHELAVVPSRPLAGQRLASRRLEQRAVPALVERARMLQSLIGGCEIALVLGLVALAAARSADKAAHQEQQQHGADGDQDDPERGHPGKHTCGAGSAHGWQPPKRERAAPKDGSFVINSAATYSPRPARAKYHRR